MGKMRGTLILKQMAHTTISNINNNKYIKERIMMGNKAYYANRQLFNSSLISRNSQLQIYRTLVRPVATYGSESWTLTMEKESALAVFERKTYGKYMDQ
jgi:hypothetical protein